MSLEVNFEYILPPNSTSLMNLFIDNDYVFHFQKYWRRDKVAELYMVCQPKSWCWAYLFDLYPLFSLVSQFNYKPNNFEIFLLLIKNI